MGANGIAQLEEPLFSVDRGTAQKYLSLNAHKLDLLGADHFVNIDAQKLMCLIFHP